MKLIYKIEFNSTALYFKKLIDELIVEDNIKAFTKQYFGFILIIFEDDSEKIEEFFTTLEKKLPISMFISKSYVIDTFDENLEEIKDFNLKANFEILTPKKVNEILEDNYFDFLDNIIKLSKNEVIEYKNIKIFLPNKEILEKFKINNEEIKLLICNSNKISNIVKVDNSDLALLCSIERPLVRLKLQDEYLNISNSKYIYTRLPNSKDMLLLSQSLSKQNIDYILYTSNEKELKAISNNDKNIVISDEKTLFPKYDFILKKVFNTKEEYFNFFPNIYKSIISYESKENISTIGVYFSQSSKNSFVDINTSNGKEKRVIYVPEIDNSIDKIFEDISSIDENSKRLIDNFIKKYPDILNQRLSNLNSFGSIIEICAKVLGLNNIIEFEELALNSSNSNGVQIDMKINKVEDKNYLDYRKIIQSIMSYKIADVDNETLAYSFYEFLAEFIIEYSKEIARQIKTKNIVLCGDIFTNRLILNKVIKELSKNHNLILPKEYPLDYI
ncbi:hypothetical protein ACNSOO_09035 [Aliarcobacter lanthieri]|uniref:Kae1-like domain-containing protein n=1 Tax=Aliarcobacter lanthieri TaxID=1355374 RepID=UPI003AADFD5C